MNTTEVYSLFMLFYQRWQSLLLCIVTGFGMMEAKEIKSEYSLEGLMLKLKPQYFGHLMQRADSLENTLMLGGIRGRRRRGQQRMRWLDGIKVTRWM